MKVIMTTRGHTPRIRMHRYATDIVCHTEDDRKRLARELDFDVRRIHPCNVPEELGTRKMGWIRDWVQDNLTAKDDWYCLIDDNSKLVCLPDPWYSNETIDFNASENWNTDFRSLYRSVLPPESMDKLVEEIKDRCIQQGTVFGGVSPEENYYFRSKKWSVACYVRGKLMVTQNVGLRWVWDPRIELLTDMARTAKVIELRGSVAVNRFAHTMYTPWESGGLGGMNERMPALKRMAEFLTTEFAGLIDYYRDSDWMVHVKLHRQTQIDKWRKGRSNG